MEIWKAIRMSCVVAILCACSAQSVTPIISSRSELPTSVRTITPEQKANSPIFVTPTIYNSVSSDRTSALANTSPISTSSTNQPIYQQITATFIPDSWKFLPIIPTPSKRVLEIYLHGLELGNNPKAFSKIGDCGSTPTWFLGDFDRGTRYYNLGNYQYLNKVISYYAGSFNRTSLAAQSGFNVSSVLTPLWADRSQCTANETPLACEYRIHKPILAFITLGANDVYHLDSFEPQMRRIIQYSIDHGVIPILSTKPDNIEKDNRINITISKLANEYQVPLWNFWLAVQPLPNHGLQEDGVHLTWSANQFENPDSFNWGWPVRNLTALHVLDSIFVYISEHYPSP